MNRKLGSRIQEMVLALGVAILAVSAGTADAVTTFHSKWTGGAAGNWSAPASWSPAVVPNDTGSNAFYVHVDSTATAASVAVDGTYVIDRLQIDAGDRVDIPNSGNLQVTAANGAGAIQNGGALQLSAGASQTNLLLQGGPITLQGGGTLRLSNSVNNWIFRSDVLGALVNMDNTIRGAGNIGWFGTAMPITNGGTIIADQSAPLLITSTSGGTTNTGTLRADLGATLRLGGGAIANAGGTVEALNGSVVELGTSTALTGGTLRTVGTGVIRVTGAFGTTLTNLVNQGQVEIPDARSLALGSGSIQNTGRINLAGGASQTVLGPAGGPVTLTGGGEIVLSNSANNWIYRSDAAGALVNENNTIHGAGNIGWVGTAMPVNNAGLIMADRPTPLVVTSTSGGFVNTGTLRADVGATMQLGNGPFTNTGGIIEALNGSIVELNNAAAVSGGTIRTVGTGLVRVTGVSGTSLTDLTNQGHMEVMNSRSLYLNPGTIQNNGRIDVSGGSSQTNVYVSGGAVTLSGGGEIALSNSVNNWIYRPDALGALINQDNTIHGAGNIGWVGTAMPITNGGIIVADQSNPLVLDPGAASFTNTGTVRAAAGAVFFCNKTPVNFSGGTLTGGTWEAVQGTLRVVGLNVSTNAASIRLNGASAAIYNAAAGTTGSLAGFGTNAAGGSFRLENGASYAAPATFRNSGTVHIETGCAFSSAGPYTQFAGRTVVNGTLTAPSPVTIQSGLLSGAGTVNGNVVSMASVSPGDSVGTLTIAGNYTQQPTAGRLVIELGGTGPGQFDVLQVAGQASLNGALELRTANGFQVQPGDTFRILNGSSCSGVFSEIDGRCLAPNLCFRVLYDGTGVTLQAFGFEVGVPAENGVPGELRLAALSAVGSDQELRLEMPRNARVDIAIYDLTGRQVARLWEGVETAGVHTYHWNGLADDGSHVGNGVYFARAEIRERDRSALKTTRLVIVR